MPQNWRSLHRLCWRVVRVRPSVQSTDAVMGITIKTLTDQLLQNVVHIKK